LCKGIYLEPRRISYRDPEIIRRSFVDLLEILLRRGSYVGIATHDEILVYEALSLIDQLGLSAEQYEFQMLLGVEEELRQILLEAGHRLRVYVPFGAQWYAYSVRRLRENPRIAGHVVRSMLKS
jgi:proline dehydrogenase